MRAIAERIRPLTASSLLRTGLVVPAGKRALLLDGEQALGVLPSGRHDLESLGRRFDSRMAARLRCGRPSLLLVVDREIRLDTLLETKVCARSDGAETRLRLGLRITDPSAFHAELDEGTDWVGLCHLDNIVLSEVRAGGEALASLARGSELDDALLLQIEPALTRSGIIINALATYAGPLSRPSSVGEVVAHPAAPPVEDLAGVVADLPAPHAQKLEEVKADAAIATEHARGESLLLDAELEARGRVYERELEERVRWFEQRQQEARARTAQRLEEVEGLNRVRSGERELSARTKPDGGDQTSSYQNVAEPSESRQPQPARGSGFDSSSASVVIEAPERVVTAGHGRLLIPVRLRDRGAMREDEWIANCCVTSGPENGDQPRVEFDQDGTAMVQVDGDCYGRLRITLEFVNRTGPQRYSGSFSLAVDLEEGGELVVHAGGHQSRGDAFIYQPLEIAGANGAHRYGTCEVTTVEVPLYPSVRAGVGLSDVLGGERLLGLEDRPGGVERVLSIATGQRLAVGRCHARQLDARAGSRLLQAGADRVGWITRWDDARVNRLTALMSFARGDAGRPRLEVENLTDYSRSPQTCSLTMNGTTETMAAGGLRSFALQDGEAITLRSGNHAAHTLASFEFHVVVLGREAVPLFKTTGTGFDHGTDDSETHAVVHSLALWLPWSATRLSRLLRSSKKPLRVGFPNDGLQLFLDYDDHVGGVVVTANENLTQTLARS